jgi:hypothetical protein|nr:MAG TPA: hypothetical protein [Caudoviricetes sp.]
MAYQTAEDVTKDAEYRSRKVFAGANTYGYQLNVNNAELNRFFEAYISASRIHRPVSDRQRIEWEILIWGVLCKYYRRCYNHSLPAYPAKGAMALREMVVSWQLTQLEDIVNYRLDVPGIIKKYYAPTHQA